MPRQNTGPRLEKNERGIWEIRWTKDRRSNRLSTRTGDLQEAQRVLAGFLVEQSKGERRGNLTVEQALQDYLREHVDQGPVVDKERQHDCAAPLIVHFGDMECAAITAPDVLAYGRARKAGKLSSAKPRKNGEARKLRAVTSDGTLRRELNMLIAAFEHAAKNKRIGRAEIPHIPLPSPPAPRDLWLDETEFEQFMAAADEVGGRPRLFCYLAGYTAARRHSIETLARAQVDLAARLVRYNPPGRIQTKKRRVPVPIADKLFAVLEPALAGMADSAPVLGHTGSAYKDFERVALLAYERTGNDKFVKITPHTLRHTWATLAVRRGVPLFEVAGVLGDTIATVTKVYAHHAPDHLRRAVNF